MARCEKVTSGMGTEHDMQMYRLCQQTEETPEDTTPDAASTTSSALEHMNETYKASQALEAKKAADAKALNDKIIDKYARPDAVTSFLKDTGEAISKLYGAHPDTMREAFSNKNFVKDLVEVMRDSAKTNSNPDTKDTKGKGK